MKKIVLLLSAVTSIFTGCLPEPGGGPVYLPEIEQKLVLDTIEYTHNVYDTITKETEEITEEIAVIPVPFNVDDYYTAEGWMGNYENTKLQKGLCEADTAYTPTDKYCVKFRTMPFYSNNPRTGWAGISWLNNSNWGIKHRAHEALTIGPNAKKVEFWAKSAQPKRKTYLNEIDGEEADAYSITKGEKVIDTEYYENKFIVTLGNNELTNSFTSSHMICVKDVWRKFEIPLRDSIIESSGRTIYDYLELGEPHIQTGPFSWVTALFDVPINDSLVFFIDNIRYSDEAVDSTYIPFESNHSAAKDCVDGDNYRMSKEEYEEAQNEADEEGDED
ncbi:MAG: hypothetical protein OCD01_02530 [Fibrobacterales bacterium]